jgi:hypothetical protein
VIPVLVPESVVLVGELLKLPDRPLSGVLLVLQV